ncbi:hypothetical protein JHL17_25350 [Azospirillum sp. YIM B02556]|uniref:PDZ domain-containing protein n=1 Tax=Azospirillum endophyticum TaxID=2800326 RepID=A0ABS1FBE1_9PROT|nr:hypothetical protein [Azospirillum endophyticum]MBK1840736.1 hypothetical protein [Azospirillum endophyticum]
MMTPYTHVQPIAELPGSLGFTVWGVGTRDEMATVLAPGYFGANARLMNDGDIVIVNRRAPRNASAGGAEKLVLAVHKGREGTITLRQVLHMPALPQEAAASAASGEKPKGSGNAGRGAARS